MKNLFGEEFIRFPKKAVDKVKRNWESRFQRWCDKQFQEDGTPVGKCGLGMICDYCTDNHYGRPCVRALNEMLRENHLEIDYQNADYIDVWEGSYW